MEIKKEVLRKALEAVKPGLANREFIEQATSFAFLKGSVVTYNDEISISYPIEGLDFEGAVHAEELYTLLGKMKDQEAVLNLSIVNNELIVSYAFKSKSKLKAGFTLQSEIKLPLREELSNKGDWYDITPDFIKALDFARTSTAKASMGKPKLTCVHVNQEGFMEASDGYRLARYQLETKPEVPTFLIPASSAGNVISFNPNKISLGKGWIHFKNEVGATLSCRLFDDTFPNTGALLNVEGETIVLPDNIASVIERASIFAERDSILNERVTITIENNKIKVQSTMEVGGWFEEEIRFSHSGSPIKFDATPYLLKEIFTKTQTFISSPKKLKFESNNWVYIAALINA